MKTLFTLCAMLVCGLTLAGEPVSVLNHGAPTPTATPAPTPVAAPAVQAVPAPVASGPALIAVPKRSKCPNGDCKLYSVEEQCHQSTRNRLLGGQIIRRSNRTVLRPVR
jgi:hypothetical protein